MSIVDLSPLHNLGNGGLPGTELVDGKHTVIDCPRCRKRLCDVWVTQPRLDIHTKIVAECDYCHSQTSEKDVKGKFHLGGTEDCALTDVKHEFLDGPTNKTGIFQKMRVITKRLK